VSDQERIRTAFERNVKALSLRPSIGRGTAVTKARLREGLTCEIEDGPWRLVADMGEKHGGAAAGPNPGVLGRGALASCMVVGYAMWAARLGVRLETLEVEVQTDYDARGEYGVDDDVAPGYTRMRWIVTVESEAPEADVMSVLEKAEKHSPYLDLFRNPQDLRREVRVVSTRR
jgi:uncharacterized OsmC-like protein